MNDPLRVLFVAPIKIYNAEAEYIHRLVRGLTAAGHHSTIMGLPGSPLLERLSQEGVRVCDTFRLTSFNPITILRDIRGLASYIEKGGFDIVNVHRSEGFIIVARAVHRLTQRPGLIRTRGDMRPVSRDPLNRRLYGQWSDRIIASNRLLEQELIVRLRLDPKKIQTIYTGIDPDSVKPGISPDEARRELGIAPDERVVACMGRIGMVKGQEYLLQAVPKIISGVPNVRFLLIYPYIEDDSPFPEMLSRSRWKEKFILAGPRSNWADLMQLADVAVMPSLWSEANCRAALEWMAMKKPIVGARVGAIPEVIEQAETGLLVHPRQAGALADAVTNLLKHPKRSVEMGQKGYERLKKYFTEQEMISKTIAVYNAVKSETVYS